MTDLIGVPGWALPVFPEPLDYRSLMGKTSIQLIKPFTAWTSEGVIVVPAGYISDGASVPQVFWNIFPPFGSYLESAVIHDYIYTDLCHLYTKKQADLIFLELLEVLRVSSWKRATMHRCVSMFGKGSWKD